MFPVQPASIQACASDSHTALITRDGQEVRVGQVWRSLSTNSGGEYLVVSLDAGQAVMDGTPQFSVPVSRMHKGRRGWVLVTQPTQTHLQLISRVGQEVFILRGSRGRVEGPGHERKVRARLDRVGRVCINATLLEDDPHATVAPFKAGHQGVWHGHSFVVPLTPCALEKQQMPITKRPCSNCPFRNDGAGIELRPGRLQSIVDDLLDDDQTTFVCHATLDTRRMTCAGALGVMHKLGRLPVIARLGLAMGVITHNDITASAALVIEPYQLPASSHSDGKDSHAPTP